VTLPLSLYVHLPWCVRKCPYCDFNSHTAGEAADKQRYVDALVEDIRLEGARAGERAIGSVFFGGGTPSYFDAGEIGRLLEAIDRSCRYRPTPRSPWRRTRVRWSGIALRTTVAPA
jgi:coproporphyrinogen III oxidase-like Fe-S oxidoreductase